MGVAGFEVVNSRIFMEKEFDLPTSNGVSESNHIWISILRGSIQCATVIRFF